MSAAEIIAMIRDIAILAILAIGILMLLFIYVKVSSLLNTVRRTMENAESVVSTISNRIVRPAASGSGTAFRLGKAAAFMSGLTGRRRQKEDSNGKRG